VFFFPGNFLLSFILSLQQHIKDFWNEISGGRKTPKPTEFTDDELDALITECISFSFNGSSVVSQKQAVGAPARRDLE
jgi:hypothetical protein